MRNIDLVSAYTAIYEDKEQIDEVAPIVAGLAKAAGKAAVTSAASTAGSNMANKMTKPKNEEVESVLNTLVSEVIAIDENAAYDILTHMSEEWYQHIVENLETEN